MAGAFTVAGTTTPPSPEAPPAAEMWLGALTYCPACILGAAGPGTVEEFEPESIVGAVAGSVDDGASQS